MHSLQLQLEDSIEVKTFDVTNVGWRGTGALTYEDLPLTSDATKRLCSMIGLPHTFLSSASPALARLAVREFYDRCDRPMEAFLAPDHEEIVVGGFAFLDSIRCGTFEFLEVLRNKGIDFEIAKESIGLSRHSMFLVSPDAYAISDGDDVQFGINLISSFDGSSPTKITSSMFRPICTNGMVLSDGSWTLNRRALNSREDVLLSMLDAATFAFELAPTFHQKCLELKHHRVDDPISVIHSLGVQHRLPSGMINKIIESMSIEPDPTMWGVVNAVTRTANHESNFSTSYGLQSVGGQVLIDHELCGHCGSFNAS
jgi:hypothetical protein